MNYYIQGNKEKADKIRAAFEKLGYDTGNLGFTSSQLYYTIEGKVELMCYKSLQNLIKTHPDYKELELPVVPKFKVGDWITSIDDEGDTAVERIVNLRDNKVLLVDIDGCFTEYPRGTLESYRLWTIADAKDGDVITNGKMIVIFNKLEEPTYKQHIIAYVGLDLCGRLQITEDIWQLGVDNAMPATKEQRDLLFSKIREVGYQWDADKKELKKIKPHYDISNFHTGMPVLVRDDNDDEWNYLLFSHHRKKLSDHFSAGGNPWFQCIPFNNDTKHLLGTTDMCDEQYINW